MFVIFGKGKVGGGLKKLLDKLNIENIIMDDQDRNDDVLLKSEKIIVSPGIKQNHKLYLNYKNKVFSELNFLGDIIKDLKLKDKLEIIGVTGTNGKSSSVHILYNLFRGIFKKLEIKTKVYLSGNFGTPLSESLIEIIDGEKKEKHLIILEVSSFMLYKLNNFDFDYSILTNLGTDHLDWHKDLQEYFDSKFKIIDYTKNYVVMDKNSLELYNNNKTTKAEIEKFQQVFDLEKTKFLGKHNQGNWNAVYKITNRYFEDHKLEWNEKVFWGIAGNIEPLDHRLKLVRSISGIKIYDDGICTSSQALNVALNSFDKKVILIAGGYDKGDDYNWLGREMGKKIGFACLIGQTAKKFEVILKEKGIDYKILKTLNEAVSFSIDKAKELKIENILFSPGSASFDMFENVYDRCNSFLKIIDFL
ncbi:MAG: UDP-N-acetylmuramoyl-L-alanine--D-glutamate ligase [Candidatus Absconditabacterales bacterium]|nr:UDP-N-acetylmuramoyl-L-alanine--D-glutamate ligase [Candidatus Absconditabacterales bacterium]